MSDTRAVPVTSLRRIVERATRAPSVHNTQPWRWRGRSHTLELFADRSRLLRATDPDARSLTISCGAVLHHAQVVASALGWEAAVTRSPDPSTPDLLARVDLSPAPPIADAPQLLATVERRCTDRRRFTSWPVPAERVEHLSTIASTWGTRGAAVTDVTERFSAERLIAQAAREQARHGDVVAERDAWLDRSTPDGVPRAVLAGARTDGSAYVGRFAHVPAADLGGQDLQLTDGLVLLFDSCDDADAWLRAGEGLSALWLAATAGGLSVVPLSQVIEVDETRAALRRDLLRGLGHPLLLVRIGWQAIGRDTLALTPRRPVEEVLELV